MDYDFDLPEAAWLNSPHAAILFLGVVAEKRHTGLAGILLNRDGCQ